MFMDEVYINVVQYPIMDKVVATAENAGIGKYVSLWNNVIPYNIETGPCCLPVNSVSSA